MNIVGIDYGDRYLGFAICDSEINVPVPVKSIKIKSMKEAISVSEEFCKERNSHLIVIGLPLNVDGTEGERASKTRSFGKVLEKITGINIVYFDERYSTLEAKEYLKEGGIKPREMKKYTDKMSAHIKLCDFMNNEFKKHIGDNNNGN